MTREFLVVVGVLAALTSLFLWSIWAGLAGIGAIAAWLLWVHLREATKLRALRQRCSTQLEQGFAAQGLHLEAQFHSVHGTGAIGIEANGRMFAYATPDSTEIVAMDAVIEGRARRLPQGSYEIGLCVPGRVSGRPYWHTVLVPRRSEALRWERTVAPLLGERLKPEGLD